MPLAPSVTVEYLWSCEVRLFCPAWCTQDFRGMCTTVDTECVCVGRDNLVLVRVLMTMTSLIILTHAFNKNIGHISYVHRANRVHFLISITGVLGTNVALFLL